MNNNKNKFLVIGLGPIGAIFASHLKNSECTIYGIDVRNEYIEAIKKNGLTIKGLAAIQINLDQAVTNINDLKKKDFDNVVIAVKTPYLPEVVSILKSMNGDFNIISMQNGIDNEEYLANSFGKHRVLRIVVNFAGNFISATEIEMTFFHKPNYIGCVDPSKTLSQAKNIAQLMTSAGLDTEFTENIKKFTWKKAILNAVLAPISALLGSTMAEVMSSEHTSSLVKALLQESIAVAEKAGYDYGEEFYQQSIDYLATAGHHKPSMLIDMENKNPTEIDFINGKLAYFGKKLNVPVPLNTAITALIKAKEQYLKK